MTDRVRLGVAGRARKGTGRLVPAAKRGHGEGSVRRLPNGRWRAELMLSGVRRSKTVDGRRLALDWLADLRRRHATGRLPPRGASRVMLGAYLAGWIRARRGEGLTVTSWQSHERNAALHLAPQLGALALDALTTQHVRALHAALLEPVGTLGPRSVRYVHATLCQALDRALEDGLLSENVARRVPPPPLPRRGPPRAMGRDELGAFLRVAEGDRLSALWGVACRLGARMGELRALRWADLDAGAGTLTVRASLPHASAHAGDARAPKTAAGARTVRLSRSILALLDGHRQRQAVERRAAGARYTDHGLVFCTRWGTALGSGNLSRRFGQLLALAGLAGRYVFHDLRHGAASIMLSRGVPVAEVAHVLGHAGPHITLAVYGHYLERSGRTALEDAEGFYADAAPKEGPP